MTTYADLVYQLGGMPVLPPNFPLPNINGSVYIVDGSNGADGNPGTMDRPLASIQGALTRNNGAVNPTIIVLPLEMAATDTDPGSYTENAVVDAASCTIVGISRGVTQGGLPQVKVGTTTTSPIISVQAPGCLIMNLGINGAGGTGGGIKYFDDGGATYASFGGSVIGCHFKNCRGTSATDAASGGAIQLSGAPWQMRFSYNRFYKNLGDIVLLDTGNAVPQDFVIDWNEFSGPAANVSCNLLLSTGGGVNGVAIKHNTFPCFPTAGGANVPVSLTNCIGILSWNTFGCSGKTFGAAANIPVPTTVGICGNYQDGALIART